MLTPSCLYTHMDTPTLNQPTDYILTCADCREPWVRRNPKKMPNQCPKCGSRHWNTPRMNGPRIRQSLSKPDKESENAGL